MPALRRKEAAAWVRPPYGKTMAEIDLKKVPFADWLEQAIPALCRIPARSIGLVALLEDGSTATSVWNASVYDQYTMAGCLIEDGVLRTVCANGAMLRDAIRSAEDEDEGKEEDNEP